MTKSKNAERLLEGMCVIGNEGGRRKVCSSQTCAAGEPLQANTISWPSAEFGALSHHQEPDHECLPGFYLLADVTGTREPLFFVNVSPRLSPPTLFKSRG